MKFSRMITYGLCGIIAGLLIENTAMAARRKAAKKVKDLKKKKDHLIKEHLHH